MADEPKALQERMTDLEARVTQLQKHAIEADAALALCVGALTEAIGGRPPSIDDVRVSETQLSEYWFGILSEWIGRGRGRGMQTDL